MEATKVNIETKISADLKKVWDYYTQPKHITNWNAASDDWCCPKAENNLREGGKYMARMEAKDGSMGFDFEAVYDKVDELKHISYTLADGRQVTIDFEEASDVVNVVIAFDAESQNSIEIQRKGWQAILNNFKKYTEEN
ncbi:MAG: SRPBCC family protein [Fulvivirga sp.]